MCRGETGERCGAVVGNAGGGQLGGAGAGGARMGEAMLGTWPGPRSSAPHLDHGWCVGHSK